MILPRAPLVDPYGSTAQELLQPLQDAFAEVVQESTEKLYEYITSSDRITRVISQLRPKEFKQLKTQQTHYVRTLLTPDLDQSFHMSQALGAGEAHQLAGIEIVWLLDAYNFYQDEIYRFLRTHLADSETRELVMRIVSQRFAQDTEGQISRYREIRAELSSAFSKLDRHIMSTDNLSDLIRGSLELIGSLPGGMSILFARPDAAGQLQIEQSYGVAAEQYHRAMEAGTIPKLGVDPEIPAGQGPGGRAWRSGQITVSDAWLIESDKAPWHQVGESLGFRSSAAVPLLDQSGRAIALYSLYSTWPGFFSTDGVHGFLSHVQQSLSHAMQRVFSAPVVPLREQQTYRQMLNERRLLLHYQPIIDLHDGTLTKIEALARMADPNGKLIPPNRFLPALGRDELLYLFEQGLEQAAQDIQTLRAYQMDPKIAINFPAEGFDDFRYERVFFNALEVFDLQPDQFQLEVLETQNSTENSASRKAFIKRLREIGVQIAQDDLGSGHSSLLRLDQYPFDEVKIDQGLVRGALRNPKRAVEFILYLTRLAHAFNIPVTVEGLENTGMIEAAAILGADRGQGFGIAKPMTVSQLPTWHEAYRYQIQPTKPRTALGAMAGYLLWDLQLAAVSERPELVPEFVGAKALIDEFIAANHLQESPLHRLLSRTYELAARPHATRASTSMVRGQLIRALTDHWLSEIAS